MANVRLSRALCAAVGDILRGSHSSLDALFEASGAPGPPPSLSHATKWKEWLFRAGSDPAVDSLLVLGNVLEEAMDIAPKENAETASTLNQAKDRVLKELEANGLRYYRGGRVLPTGQSVDEELVADRMPGQQALLVPSEIDKLLNVLLKGLRRAMHPLTHRRKGATSLSFLTEYDVQDMLHALLRPWVADIRPEEFTPSYAGSSTRMDFLLPKYKAVIEIKFVRDAQHSKRIGDELIIDIDHYRRHPDCAVLWCVVFDPDHLLLNADGLKGDLEGVRSTKDGTVLVKVQIL